MQSQETPNQWPGSGALPVMQPIADASQTLGTLMPAQSPSLTGLGKPPRYSVSMSATKLLPPGVHVFERGWLSSNNVLLNSPDEAWLVDTGHVTHAAQTLALVRQRLGPQALNHVVNTHLHSDHCGGNAALQTHFSELTTWIPTNSWAAVSAWDEAALSYQMTGQECAQFTAQRQLLDGQTLHMAGLKWEVLAAPGHDNDAVLLHQATHGLLIAGDAIWAQGLSVVFPEIDGESGFDGVAATLDLIERLQPKLVIAGHGPLITDLAAALAQSRSRLQHFQSHPVAHATYAAKVLLKFHLLTVQQVSTQDLQIWAMQSPHLLTLHTQAGEHNFSTWIDSLVQGLVKSRAAMRTNDVIRNL